MGKDKEMFVMEIGLLKDKITKDDAKLDSFAAKLKSEQSRNRELSKNLSKLGQTDTHFDDMMQMLQDRVKGQKLQMTALEKAKKAVEIECNRLTHELERIKGESVKNKVNSMNLDKMAT
jgi:seryl-tRNA synthetase